MKYTALGTEGSTCYNRTIEELKDQTIYYESAEGRSYNRTIEELKVVTGFFSVFIVRGYNRTIEELKDFDSGKLPKTPGRL